MTRPRHPQILDELVGATAPIPRRFLELALDLDLLGKIAGQSMTIDEAANLWGMPTPSARLMAQHLVYLGLMGFQDGQLYNVPMVEEWLKTDSWALGYVLSRLRRDLTVEELLHALLEPSPQTWYLLRDEGRFSDERIVPVAEPFDDWSETFYMSSHGTRIDRGESLAEAYDFSAHRHLLDVGGATGGYCVGIRRRFPHLRCTVFEIPVACPFARRALADEEHIDVVEGSLFENELPKGADVALLANVLHDWSPEDGRHILSEVLLALPVAGVVVVSEFFLEDDWSGPYKGLTEAVAVIGPEGRSGWQPSYGEMEELLAEAGFVGAERRAGLVVARSG